MNHGNILRDDRIPAIDIVSASTQYMQNAAYNPAGALVGATLGLDGANQWTESRIYNSRLQARRVEVTKGASTLLRLRWAYSGAYNSTTLEETGTDNNGDLRVERLEHLHQGALQTVDRSYAYTGADRLSTFSETGGKYQYYGHDAFGNVWQTYVSGVPSLRQTGSSWYLLGSTVNNRLANTTYDAMGNQTQLSVSAGTVASYDGENRMSKIAVGGAEIASCAYDAEGRRVAKTANGTTTYYFYDAFGQLMAEYGGPSQTAATHYFTTDYLGSTRMILGATGNCLERLDYAPFGGQITRSGQECYGSASSEKPLYTGQMRDGESAAGTDTGQDYFNARYFWAAVGRFTSPDAPFADQRPEDGQSWNMYAYVRNNPLLYMDPSGTICVSPGNGNPDYDDTSMPGPSCAEIAAADQKITSNETVVGEREDLTFWQRLGLDPFYKIARSQQENIEAGLDPNDFSNVPQVRAEIPIGPGIGGGNYLFRNWYRGTFPNRMQSVRYHWRKHGRSTGVTPEQYTRDARAFFEENISRSEFVRLKDGSLGLRIKLGPNQPGGYFKLNGEIVSFWY